MKDSDISSEESKSFPGRVQALLLHERMKMRESVSRSFVGLLHAAREERTVIRSDESIPALTKELTVINKDILLCASELSKELRNKFEIPGLAIIILGSNTHGGATIRKLFQTLKSPDFDYALCSDLKDISSNLRDINNFVTLYISNNKARFNLPIDFETCGHYAGKAFVRNFENKRQTKEYLLSNIGNVGDLSYLLLLYFQPSVPPELNLQNQKYILEALADIANDNRGAWSLIVTSLVNIWKSVHGLEPKHFGFEGGKPQRYDYKNNEHAYRKAIAEWERLTEICKRSNQVMSKPFEDLLMSTAKS